MVEVKRYIRATKNGNFVNVPAHRRRQPGPYRATASTTSDGFGNVSIYTPEGYGYRALFVSDPKFAKDIAEAINADAVRPRKGFMR